MQPEPKLTKKTLTLLTNYFSYLSPRSNRAKGTKVDNEEFVGEYQTLLEQEFFDFVLFEVPWIVN
jgi:V-type H+-transporting ATPase subunit C